MLLFYDVLYFSYLAMKISLLNGISLCAIMSVNECGEVLAYYSVQSNLPNDENFFIF